MKNKHSLIIGGTRGIGRSLAKVLLAEGHEVSVVGRRKVEPAQALPQVNYWAVDLVDKERLDATLGEIVAANGPLTSLIFVQRYRGDDDTWAGEIATSLTAIKHAVEYLTDHFAEGGAIVVVSSIISQHVVLGQPISYHVAKAGIDQMVRYYAVTLGPKGIRVNSVSPGTVMKEEAREFYMKNDKLLDLFKQIIPIGRIGTAEEIANVIAFLCSPKASLITGQNIVADGGMTLQSPESIARRLAGL